jgi:hypothetical protein
MKLHYITRQKIAMAIVGDGEARAFAPYRTWAQMLEFFYMLDVEDLNAENTTDDLGSRVKYASAVLKKLEGTDKITVIITELFKDIYYTDYTDYDKQKVADFINLYLKKDGYEVKQDITGEYKVYGSNSEIINSVKVPFADSNELTQEFIITQINQAKKRILEKDYLGAITSAKSLLEGVFAYIDMQINDEATIRDKDDLVKQYSAIKSILNLDPADKDLDNSSKQILQGLNSIVCGLSFFRNKMSDAHLPKYMAEKHHALLAVNSANTLAQFLFDTYNYQVRIGRIKK